jgi:hypothetical protein
VDRTVNLSKWLTKQYGRNRGRAEGPPLNKLEADSFTAMLLVAGQHHEFVEFIG